MQELQKSSVHRRQALISIRSLEALSAQITHFGSVSIWAFPALFTCAWYLGIPAGAGGCLVSSVVVGRRLLLLEIVRTLRRLLHLRHGSNMCWFKNSLNWFADIQNLVLRRALAPLNEP
jgi:hypothetical protein